MIDPLSPETENMPGVAHVEPVLAVRDVSETVNYWKEILGFTNGWTYGNPVNHGGVSWNGAGFIQFSFNPKAPEIIMPGHSIWIRARNLEALHQLHVDRRADIVSNIENKPWGFAEYTVKELNGYYLHFSAPASDRGSKSQALPDSVEIKNRIPTNDEMKRLVASVGWPTGEENDGLLNHCVTGVVALDSATGATIGAVLLYGDSVGFYYVKNLVVDPTWQGKNVGTSLMRELMKWLRQNAPDGVTVGLFTGDHLANFYRQFGFMQCCGMYQQIIRQNN